MYPAPTVAQDDAEDQVDDFSGADKAVKNAGAWNDGCALEDAPANRETHGVSLYSVCDGEVRMKSVVWRRLRGLNS